MSHSISNVRAFAKVQTKNAREEAKAGVICVLTDYMVNAY